MISLGLAEEIKTIQYQAFLLNTLRYWQNWSNNYRSSSPMGSIRYSPGKSTQHRAVLGQNCLKQW
jgi:hypothetical protein